MQLSRNWLSDQEAIPAGDFSSWLREIRKSLLGGDGVDVACGECVGCCISSYFIHVSPQEKETLYRIPKEVLFPAPGQINGNFLMGYDQAGLCPMLKDSKCEIYDHRPQTCREFDCRVFAAAGIPAGGEEKTIINQRVERWSFSYPDDKNSEEHLAVKAAAMFIRSRARYFPGGQVPDNPIKLAILAIKSYDVFIGRNCVEETQDVSSFVRIASEIVEACRRFDLDRREFKSSHNLPHGGAKKAAPCNQHVLS